MSLQQNRRIILSLFLTFVPAVAFAQESDTRTSVLVPGTWSIQLPFPTEDAAAMGIWKMRTENTALGLMGSVQLRRDADGDEVTRTFTDINIGPALKRYHRLHPTVAAYGLVGLTGIVQRISDDTAVQHLEQTIWGGAVNAGIGAEWFPFSRVSLGGMTGLSAGVTATTRNDTPADRSTFFLNTSTSAVQVQIYF